MKSYHAILFLASLAHSDAFSASKPKRISTSLSAFPTEFIAALSSPEVPVDVLASSGVQAKVVATGAGVAAALAGLFGFRKSDSTPSPSPAPPMAKPEPIDVSIPYDAAARLDFTAWLASHPEAVNDDTTFAKFKPLYEAKAVADVIVKKQMRDLQLAQDAAAAAAKALDEL
ncbi:hypothetical protein FisN_3Lh080 [Fistulifera solaris]|uniref:Uncharacterized protein n=1 Tax=Fistulifera solaris TaxID=1519565 RepID=A0A1Z5JZ78_FISSO|nr:hypothetical protein FisN_3Lh080 [Fistulifera solaris]|eukprot:GAX19138.1 hypothetical protein FisN_3Lh080 [Fistulifera solaris]